MCNKFDVYKYFCGYGMEYLGRNGKCCIQLDPGIGPPHNLSDDGNRTTFMKVNTKKDALHGGDTIQVLSIITKRILCFVSEIR